MDVIDLGEFVLYQIVSANEEDRKFLKKIKDKDARKFHLKTIIRQDLKGKGVSKGSSYIIKTDGIPIGYAYISEVKTEGNVVISYAIHKDFRNAHYGRRVISSLSGHILKREFVSGVVAYVNVGNIASKKVLLHSGFRKISGLWEVEIYRRGR